MSVVSNNGSSGERNDVNAIAGVVKNILGDAKSGIIGGVRKSLGSYLSGFKQGGIKCLGKQAFNQGDLHRAIAMTEESLSKLDYNNGHAVASYISDRELEIVFNEGVILILKSPCSKDNTRTYIDFLKGLIKQILDRSPYEFKKGVKDTDWSGVIYKHSYYAYVGEKSVGLSVLPNPVPDVELSNPDKERESDELPVGNLLDGIDPALYTPSFIPPEREIEGLELVGTADDPTWNIGGGGRTKDGIDWSFGAGKQQDNTVQLLLIGMFGLLAYKVFFDRR